MKKLSLLVVLLSSALISQAQLMTKKALTLDAAKQIAAAAQAEAKKNNFTMVICVVDDGGNLMYLEKMDGTQLGSIVVAQAKATTALKFKRPSKALEDAVAGGRNAVLALPGVTPVEGGVPITIGGEILGAIGVSGGTSPQDGQVAAAGVAAAAKLK